MTVFAPATTRENSAMVAGPMSTAILPSGMLLHHLVGRARRDLRDHDVVHRQQQFVAQTWRAAPWPVRSCLPPPAICRWAGPARAGRCTPWRRRSRRRSTTLPRFWMTSILSDTLAPPRIATQGRGGLVVAMPRYFSSCSISRPAAACGTKRDHALGGGVRAVRGAERVVDVEVAQRGEFLGERRIVLLFLGMEAQILEQQDFAGRGLHGLDFGPDAIGRHLYGTFSNCSRRAATGCRLISAIGLAFGTAEVRCENHRRRPVPGRIEWWAATL